MYDLIILGSGPAGLTAAVYAIRKRLNVLVIAPDMGGKANMHMYLPEHLERFQVITGDEIVSRFKSQIEYLNYAYRNEVADQVQVIQGGYQVWTTDGGKFETKALLVATGSQGIPLNVPGETEYRMHGLGYSAISYAPLFIDRIVAVVGEGELGDRSALELGQCAQKVYYIVPSGKSEENPLTKKVHQASNVSILDGYKVKEIKGDGNYVRSIVVLRDGDEKDLEVDVTFVEMGLVPNSGCVSGFVRLNDKKQIMVDSRNRTSAPGIFAAGDVTDTFAEQVLICIGEGAKAALSAYEYILSL